MSEDVSGDFSPSISFSKVGQELETMKIATLQRTTMSRQRRYSPGAFDSSRVPKGSGTINNEAPESTSRLAAGFSAGRQGMH